MVTSKEQIFRTLALLTTTLICLCTTNVESAEQSAQISNLIQQAEAKHLSQHKHWLRLLHYKNEKEESEIISPNFFLSSEGTDAPSKELAATIRAFFIEPENTPDTHAQCRFIARYTWLKKELDWSKAQPPTVRCKQFNDWSLNGQVKSISLVFVTGYLSNPASFYGHILLKANPRHSTTPVDLLAQSINYGAIVPENENPVKYITYGLFGGYRATFSHAQFFRYNHNYGEDELRDMWEYELALSPDEVDQLLSHAWELLGTEFTYYFTKENCAYRMSELIELVTDQPLFSHKSPWLIPTTSFDHLASMKHNGAPLVQQISRIPSRQNRFSSEFSSLDGEQKHFVRTIAENTDALSAPEFIGLQERKKTEIIDTLVDYYEFRILAESDDDEYRQRKRGLMIERINLPPQSSITVAEEREGTPPHEAPKPTMLRPAIIHNSQLGSGISFEFRPAYYDLLAPDTGRIPNSKLTMFDLTATYLNDALKIRSFEFVDVETLNLSQTHLPGDGGMAWKIRFGLDSQNLSCNDCLIFNINGGIGKATVLTKNTIVYGMVEGLAQTKYQKPGTLSGIACISLLSTPTPAWKTVLSLGHKRYSNHSQSGNRLIKWENRIGTSRNWDLRISYNKDVAHEVGIATSFYW